MTTKLATINLEVTDVARSKQFYSAVLGMVEDTARSRPPGFAYLRSGGCDLTLAGLRVATDAPPSPTMELGFEVDDLGAMKAHLEASGVGDYREDSMGWGSAVELRDPDGHRIIVYRLEGEPEGRPA